MSAQRIHNKSTRAAYVRSSENVRRYPRCRVNVFSAAETAKFRFLFSPPAVLSSLICSVRKDPGRHPNSVIVNTL